jgi:hypothetical protein
MSVIKGRGQGTRAVAQGNEEHKETKLDEHGNPKTTV